MGLPVDSSLAYLYGMQELSFEHLSRGASGRLIGNGMSIPCVGAVMFWCHAYCRPYITTIPKTVTMTEEPVVHAEPHADEQLSLPTSVADDAWLALGSLGRALCSHDSLNDVYLALRSGLRPPVRIRDLYPLPLIEEEHIAATLGISGVELGDAKTYVDAVIVGLNWMYGFRGCDVSIGSRTSAHRAAHEVIWIALCFCMASWQRAWASERVANGLHLRREEQLHVSI